MKALVFLLGLGLVAALSGCGSSEGPEDELPYPDIYGLVAFYQFDGDGTDAGPNGLDATIIGALEYVADHNGRAGSAIYVEGNADTIRVTNRGAFDITGEITLAGWIKPEFQSYAYCCVIDKGYLTAYGVGVSGALSPTTSPLRMYIADHEFYVLDAVPVGEGTWTHFACSFNDDTDVGTLYINGEFAGEQEYPVDLGTTGFDLRIGTSQWGDAFRGALDQIAVFSRELTADEVQDLYEFD